MRLLCLLTAALLPTVPLPAQDEPIVYLVSKAGQPGYPKVKFDELWAALRVEYYLDDKGNLVSHEKVDRVVQSFFESHRRIKNAYGFKGGTDGLVQLWGSKARLKVVGLAPTGEPLVSIVPLPRTESGGPFQSRFTEESLGYAQATKYVKADGSDRTVAPKAYKFYPVNPKKAYTGTFDSYAAIVDVTSQIEEIREIGAFPDSPENRQLFLDALKGGREFMVYMPNCVSCPPCKGFGRGSGNDRTPCTRCSGTGRNSAVYLLKWE